MSPFLRRRAWWDRVPRSDGERIRVPLGTRDAGLARDISRMLDHLADPMRDFELLDMIARKKVSPAEVWDAERTGTRGQLKARVLAVREVEEDTDLTPLVKTWHQELQIATKDDYLFQLRSLIPEGGRFPRSIFTRPVLKEWLAKKPRKYRAAASNFAGWLIERDVLHDNPVRLVKNKKAGAPRNRHLTLDEAQRLVAAFPEPHATLHALMLGTGMEVSAALTTTYAGIDRQNRTVQAHGTKNTHRDREVRVTEEWCWKRLDAFLRANPGMGDALLFPFHYNTADRAMRRARIAAKITDYRTHDHRHTYAVWLLKRGVDDQAIADQLGHKDATMIRRVYGRYASDASDFVGTRSDTHSTERAAS